MPRTETLVVRHRAGLDGGTYRITTATGRAVTLAAGATTTPEQIAKLAAYELLNPGDATVTVVSAGPPVGKRQDVHVTITPSWERP